MKALLSLFALALLVGNCLVIAKVSVKSKIGAGPLLRLNNALLMFGVFYSYETNNEELTIWGLATNTAKGTNYWKQLAFDDYFPFERADRNRRIWDNMHYYNNGKEGHWKAWQFSGQRILARHNQLYPYDPISQVSYESLSWPRSSDGFYAARSPSNIFRRYWVIADRYETRVRPGNEP